MDRQIDDIELSDDEIFFGKMTLKEVKKHLMLDQYRHSLPCTEIKAADSDCSLKIIETCSEPEVISEISIEDSQSSFLSSSDEKTTNNWNITTDNKSFLEMEKMVSNLLLADNKEKDNLNNTQDVVEYILNNAPHTEECPRVKNEAEGSSESSNYNKTIKLETKIDSECTDPTGSNFSDLNNKKCCSNEEEKTPVKERHELSNCEMSQNINGSSKKIIEKIQQNKSLLTPNCNGKQVNVFKTPKTTVPLKKQLQTPRSTSKLKAYEHIQSPIATYIRSSPQIGGSKDIGSKKIPSNTSLIPKPITGSITKLNKENNNLPSSAYRSSKTVKVIKTPEHKTPESQLVKSLSLKKPIVMKHNQREISVSKKLEPQTGDSFADLSLQQADVSVCTKKTAYNNFK